MKQKATEEILKADYAFFLHRLQSPINIGQILRIAESFGFSAFLNDGYNVLQDLDKKARVMDFSCGAWQRGICRFSDSEALKDFPSRRLIATTISQDAVPLTAFRYQSGDIFILGNEYDGLDNAVIEIADVALTVPMPDISAPKLESIAPIDPSRQRPVSRDGDPNMSVAMTAAVIAYKAYEQALDAVAAG